MKRLRICLLCADVARNAFGRAYILARVLARDFEVQVVGPQFGSSVWRPMVGLLEKHGIAVTAVPARGYPRYFQAARQIWQSIQADVLYALKPFPTSFGLALLYQRRHKLPLLLDIDDWELGVYAGKSRRQLWQMVARGIASPNNYLWLRQSYGRTRRADAITVSSRFLQQKYGGVIVPHGRDTAAMDPAKISPSDLSQHWGIHGKVILFLGTLRPHKGVEDMMAAVQRLGRLDVSGVIVGAEASDPYVARLKEQAGSRISFLPMQPFEEIPALLRAAEVVVIPQRQTTFGEAQVPAKIFDAMAMGRPIVSTAISDIPTILDGCGLVVAPGDLPALAEAIARLVDNQQEAAALGRQARERCIASYSWDSMQQTLQTIIHDVTRR